MSCERFQNPVIGSDIILRLFTWNSNDRMSVAEVQSVDIYFLDKTEITETNPDGRRLVRTEIPPNIFQVEVGEYAVSFNLETPIFTIGNYLDVWNIVIRTDENPITITNGFVIWPDLWYTDIRPLVYDFSFDVRPNKLRKGSIRYLIVGIHPNVPKASDLVRYYENIATISPLKIYVEMECVDCMPAAQDLRLVVDGAPVDYREKCTGFYQLDTTEMACGVYSVWFEMIFGDSIYVSEKQQIQIF